MNLSIQELIKDSLAKNKRFSLHSKKRYRTETVSGPELEIKILKLRNFLERKGIKKGDKILIVGPGSVEWVTVYFASILSGIIVVPLDIMTDRELVQKIQAKIRARAIFQSRSINLKLEKKAMNFYLEELWTISEEEPSKALPISSAGPDDILEIQFTSGTTGDPKGVILTHRNIFSAVNEAINTINIKIHLKFLNILPLSHVYSQIMGIFMPLYLGWGIFFLDTVQPRKIADYIKNKGIHLAIFVPGILAALKKELEGKCVHCSLGFQFRIIGVGGASLDVELEKWWKRKMIFVLQGYGMTETSSVISINSPFSSRTGSVGKIASIVQAKINEDGEILVKGENITKGYFEDKEKTKDSFDKGWFKTGDIGEIKNKYLFIKERKKDIIITPSGLKAYPADIEEVLNSFEGVKSSCALQKDRDIHAVLILYGNAKPDEIVRKANEKLMSHQKIAGFSVWHEDEFPKTPIGKVKKFLLLQAISSREKPASKKVMYETHLYNVIHKVLKPDRKIKRESKLVDLGMDSLKRVELISELENEFGVEINETDVHQNTDVLDIENALKNKNTSRVRFKSWPASFIVRGMRTLFNVILMRPLIRIFTKTEYLGIENIAGINKPVVFVSNHQSALDVPLITRRIGARLAVAADSQVVFGIGTKNFFERIERKILGIYSSFSYNAYPFGETIGTEKGFEFTGEFLDRGYSILIFPEGERTPDGKIHAFKPGIGFIVANMKAPVVPIKISGLYEVLPKEKIIPKFGKTSIKYGKPISFDEKILSKMSYNDVTSLIEKELRKL